jgi:hypothetical protein
MIPALHNDDIFFVYGIDQPMFLVYAARPQACQIVAKRFGLAYAMKWIALNVSD